MELYLVQHGEATSEQEDRARPLSDRGRVEVTWVALTASRADISIAAIYHSGKLRARQTAELLARTLQPKTAPRQLDGLAPMDDPTITSQAIDSLETPAMLVGHLPHMSRLCSLLVTGDVAREVVTFRMGGIVCLSRDERSWQVRWILTPEMAPQSTHITVPRP